MNDSMASMRGMIFRIAAMQPIHIDPESVKPPKRRNVKISKDPQSVATRHRCERISERIIKFLKNQVQSLERATVNRPPPQIAAGIGFPVPMSSYSTAVGAKGYQSTTTYWAN